MKVPMLAMVASAFLFSLTGCNGVGPKETLLAKINDESIYREDILYMLNGGRYDRDSVDLSGMLYERYYGPSALVSRAKAEYPELEEEWKELSTELDIRWLTTVYRNSYLSECMGYSEAELLKFYNENKSQYPTADSITGFYGVRGIVAGDYYIQKNKEAFDKFLKEELALVKNPSEGDSSKAKSVFLHKKRSEILEKASGNILEERHYKIVELPAIDPKAYYERHKDAYMTVPGYVVYHVQGADSLKLSSLPLDGADLSAFKKVAFEKSENKESAADSGLVGYVKKGHALPYNIGVLPLLDSVLESKSAGFVTPVIRDVNNVFHKFYLGAVVPSKLKPYDRVEPAILKAIENDELLDVDSATVLVTKDGNPVLTEVDLLKFNDKFMKRTLTKRSHDWTVKMLAEHYAYSDAARELKLDHEWEYRALVRSARLEFYLNRYMTRVLSNVSEDSAKVWFNKYLAADNPLTQFDDVKERVTVMAAFPDRLLLRDYYMGYGVMYAGQSYEKLVSKLFDRRIGEYQATLRNRLMAEAYNESRVHLYDGSIAEFKPVSYAQKMLSMADSLYEAGDKDGAIQEYRSLFYAYPQVDSLAELSLYKMADIRSEIGEYAMAESEYYAYYKIFPKGPNAERAMFSRGFLLNENLHSDSLAQAVLTDFVRIYPQSEFKESANWLIKNIESGGRLQEELSKKIEENP